MDDDLAEQLKLRINAFIWSNAPDEMTLGDAERVAMNLFRALDVKAAEPDGHHIERLKEISRDMSRLHQRVMGMPETDCRGELAEACQAIAALAANVPYWHKPILQPKADWLREDFNG